MADVWKSQGRKFCTICKVWFGDNRASIEFHERGRKHKDALAAKLRELGRASKEKEREQSKMNSALAAMEAAALKSMREHGEALEQGPALPCTGLASRIFDPRQMKDVGLMAREMAKRKNEMKELHNQKRSSAAAPPVAKYFKRDLHTTIDYSEFTAPIVKEEQEPVAASSSAQGFWVEADAGDGRNYYFHMYTGESTWDRPESFLTAEQYGMYLQSTGAALKTEIPDVKEEECSSHPSELPVENTAVEEASGSVAVKSEPCDDDMIDFSSEIADIPLPETVCGRMMPTVFTLPDTEEKAIFFLQQRGVLPSQKKCKDGHQMKLIFGNRQTFWRCSKVSCGRQKTYLTSGTWFRNMNLTFVTAVRFLFGWSQEQTSLKWCKEQLSMSSTSCKLWNARVREAIARHVRQRSSQKIGGQGMVVEVDETLFSKRKFSADRVFRAEWIVGGICRETKECFLKMVEDRSADVLLKIIEENVADGTTLHTDCWKGYSTAELENAGFQHLKMNHRYNFVDPDSGAQTQTIEALWSSLKWANERRNGTSRNSLDSYLTEFIWRQQIGRQDPFNALLDAIRDFVNE